MKTLIVSRNPKFPEGTLKAVVARIIGGELRSLDQFMDACHSASAELGCLCVSFVISEEFGSDRVIYTLKAFFH